MRELLKNRFLFSDCIDGIEICEIATMLYSDLNKKAKVNGTTFGIEMGSKDFALTELTYYFEIFISSLLSNNEVKKNLVGYNNLKNVYCVEYVQNYSSNYNCVITIPTTIQYESTVFSDLAYDCYEYMKSVMDRGIENNRHCLKYYTDEIVKWTKRFYDEDLCSYFDLCMKES